MWYNYNLQILNLSAIQNEKCQLREREARGLELLPVPKKDCLKKERVIYSNNQMKFKPSDHAKFRKRHRHITDAMITEALTKPNRIGVGYLNRQLAYKTFPEGEIKVVYVIENNIPFVISVMWEKGGPKCR